MDFFDKDALLKDLKNRIDEAIEWQKEASKNANLENEIRAEATIAAFCECILTIKAMPAIAAREVKHAKWEDQYKDGDWHCTNCGAIIEKDEQIRHNWYFCYHCGAIMRKPFKEEK